MIDRSSLEPYQHRAEIRIKEFSQSKLNEISFPEDYTNVEKCIVYLRKCGHPYRSIQMDLGMISKKLIKTILNDFDPELVNMDTNYHKIPDNLHKNYDWDWNEFKREGSKMGRM